jgi:GDP-4-dehydro-6-deoxy-D-mannose reductase
MRILITGVTGFSGNALVHYLIEQGYKEIWGITRQNKFHRLKGVTYQNCDLNDVNSLEKIVEEIDPERVIHLAGETRKNLPNSQYWETNVIGTRNLLDAIFDTTSKCRILVTSSSAVYGYGGSNAINEKVLPRPLNFYAKSKVAQEVIALNHRFPQGSVAIARPFNLIGPSMDNNSICSQIVNHVIDTEKNKKNILELYEMETSRDFIDVRDAVKGYWAIISQPNFSTKCKGHVFNIGSGHAYSKNAVISIIEKITGEQLPISATSKTQTDQINPIQYSNISKVTEITGWKPEIPLEQSLEDMLIFYRKGKAKRKG